MYTMYRLTSLPFDLLQLHGSTDLHTKEHISMYVICKNNKNNTRVHKLLYLLYLWQLFQTVLAFIENYYEYDVKVWPHLGTRWCGKLHSFLLVSFIYPSGSHDQCLFWLILIGLNRLHVLNNLACHFQLNCLHQVVLFIKKQEDSLIRVFEINFVVSLCRIFHKNDNARGK